MDQNAILGFWIKRSGVNQKLLFGALGSNYFHRSRPKCHLRILGSKVSFGIDPKCHLGILGTKVPLEVHQSAIWGFFRQKYHEWTKNVIWGFLGQKFHQEWIKMLFRIPWVKSFTRSGSRCYSGILGSKVSPVVDQKCLLWILGSKVSSGVDHLNCYFWS